MKYLLERKIPIFITNLKMADQKQRNHLTLEVKNSLSNKNFKGKKKKARETL